MLGARSLSQKFILPPSSRKIPGTSLTQNNAARSLGSGYVQGDFQSENVPRSLQSGINSPKRTLPQDTLGVTPVSPEYSNICSTARSKRTSYIKAINEGHDNRFSGDFHPQSRPQSYESGFESPVSTLPRNTLGLPQAAAQGSRRSQGLNILEETPTSPDLRPLSTVPDKYGGIIAYAVKVNPLPDANEVLRESIQRIRPPLAEEHDNPKEEFHGVIVPSPRSGKRDKRCGRKTTAFCWILTSLVLLVAGMAIAYAVIMDKGFIFVQDKLVQNERSSDRLLLALHEEIVPIRVSARPGRKKNSSSSSSSSSKRPSENQGRKTFGRVMECRGKFKALYPESCRYQDDDQ